MSKEEKKKIREEELGFVCEILSGTNFPTVLAEEKFSIGIQYSGNETLEEKWSELLDGSRSEGPFASLEFRRKCDTKFINDVLTSTESSKVLKLVFRVGSNSDHLLGSEFVSLEPLVTKKEVTRKISLKLSKKGYQKAKDNEKKSSVKKSGRGKGKRGGKGDKDKSSDEEKKLTEEQLSQLDSVVSLEIRISIVGETFKSMRMGKEGSFMNLKVSDLVELPKSMTSYYDKQLQIALKKASESSSDGGGDKHKKKRRDKHSHREKKGRRHDSSKKKGVDDLLKEDQLFLYDLSIDLPMAEVGQFEKYSFAGGKVAKVGDKYVVKFPKLEKLFFLCDEGLKTIEKKAILRVPMNLALSRRINPLCKCYNDAFEDFNSLKYVGVIGIIVDQLLVPGKKEISGKYAVTNVRVDEKKKEEMQKEVEKKLKATKVKTKKKGGLQWPEELLPDELDDEEKDPNLHPYEQAKTQMFITLSLSDPFIDLPRNRKRTETKLVDIIPKRKEYVKKISSLELFEKKVSKISNYLLRELEDYKKTGHLSSEVSLKEGFVFYLNKSGKYYGIKEELKTMVIEIIKENYSTSIKDLGMDERNKILNEVYFTLIKKINEIISSFFSEEKEEFTLKIPSAEDEESKVMDKLKQYAEETTILGNHDLTRKCLEKRVTISLSDLVKLESSISPKKDVLKKSLLKTISMAYYDVGIFELQQTNFKKSEELLKESIKHSMTNADSLLTLGVLLCVQKRYDEAEVFFQSSVDLNENDALAWGLLALFFSLTKNNKEKHKSLLMVNRIIQKRSEENFFEAYFIIIHFLLSLNIDDITETLIKEQFKMIEKEETDESVRFELLYYYAKVEFIRKKYEQAEKYLQDCNNIKQDSPKVWSLLGNVNYFAEKLDASQVSYERALKLFENPEDSDTLIHVRLGFLYIKKKFYEDSKEIFLQASKLWSTGIIWLGLGISYYHMKDLKNSELCLNEANIHNNINPMIWGYLTLISLQKGHFDDADRSLRICIRNGLKDNDLLDDIKKLYDENSRSQEFKKLMSLK